MSVSGSATHTSGRRARLLVLNQYYWPGFEATAQLLSQLCEELAQDYDVTVITGTIAVPGGDRSGEATHEGVDIVRVASTAFDRTRLLPRAANYLTYLASSAREALKIERPDVVLCMTDPPIVADIALLVARRFRAPLVVISQDVFPEIAVELKRLENPVLVHGLRVLIDFYLRRADRVVAIGDTMRRRLQEKGVPPDRLVVIPNWVDTSRIAPVPQDNEWAREHELAGKFVVMHSGNVGHAQNLDALIRAGTFLRDLEDFAIVIIGTGARLLDLQSLARRLEADNVRFLPYQPRELLSQTLAAANVHVVGLARGLAGYVVPSRLYGILAAGRPVIAAADEESETAQLVRAAECGLVVPPGRPELLARAIREAYDGRYDLGAWGGNARRYVVEEGDRKKAFAKYRALVEEVAALG